MEYNSENIFLEKYADPNKTYKPSNRFTFKDGSRYTPDFYCVEDDVFIEVVGKYYFPFRHKKMREEYPNIRFKIFFVIKPFIKLPNSIIKCTACDYQWESRVDNPKMCPDCKCNNHRVDPLDIPFSNL